MGAKARFEPVYSSDEIVKYVEELARDWEMIRDEYPQAWDGLHYNLSLMISKAKGIQRQVSSRIRTRTADEPTGQARWLP